MKQVIELDEKDIQVVMAEKFKCSPDHVLISVTDTYAGYGPTEYKTHKVTIIIKREDPLC